MGAGGSLFISGTADVTAEGSYPGLFATGGIFISGGKVHTTGTNDSGIFTNGTLSISGTADVTASGGLYCGLQAGGAITISGGTVNATSPYDSAIYTPVSITVTGSPEITAKGALRALQTANLDISGGTINATSTDDSAITAKTRLSITGDARVIANGKICALLAEDVMNLSAKRIEAYSQTNYAVSNVGNDITIGGKLIAESKNVYAIRSNGNIITDNNADISTTGGWGGIQADGDITFNGSRIEAIGNDDDGIYATGVISINGGFVHAKGASGYAAIRVKSVQIAGEAAVSKIVLSNLAEKNGGKVAFIDWFDSGTETKSFTTFIGKNDTALNTSMTNALNEVWLAAPYNVTFQVEYSQPGSGGSISASSEGNDVESGSHIESGKSVTLAFSPLRGYSLKAAYVNEEEVSVSADGTYRIDSLENDISVRAEFKENTISGKLNMSAAGDSPEGITVTLYGTFGEKEAETMADREGNYVFSGIPYGEYTVGIEETDRYTAEKVVVVLNSAAASAETITPVLKLADKTPLTALISDMKKADLSKYTQASADQFRRVLSEAEILAGKNLTADQAADITNMIAKLNQAKSSLIMKADKSALLALITSMKKIDLSPYTQASADQLRAALSEAEALAGKELSVEQAADITNMIAKLNQAKNSLAKKPGEQPAVPMTAPVVKAKSTGYKTVELTWKKLNNVSGYEVYRRYNKKTWSRLKDVSQKTSYRDSKAVTGRKYQYAVKAYRIVNGKKTYGPMSKVLSQKAMPSKPEVSAKVYKKAANKVTWKKVSGSQKYMIYRKTTAKKAKWEKIATVKSNVRTYVDRKAKKGKKYYYAVRSYRKSSGLSCYSSYGSSKRVTTRK